MKKLKVVVSLITQENDYQREQASVAEATGKRLGLEVHVVYANGDAIVQTQQLLGQIHTEAGLRPDAVIVEPVGTGMLPVATAAAKNGVAWVVVNRESDYLAEVRSAATVPVGSVLSDNVEIGRIQGRQLGALLPAGGPILLIEGPANIAKPRRGGLEETMPAGIEIQTVRGKWTEESGAQAVASRLEGGRTPSVALICSQNDDMAVGARKAMEALPPGPARDAWLKLPFMGVDGVPATGQAWVKQGLLAATVVTPALTGLALEMLVKSLSGDAPFPEHTVLKPTSYPPLDELRARAGSAPAG